MDYIDIEALRPRYPLDIESIKIELIDYLMINQDIWNNIEKLTDYFGDSYSHPHLRNNVKIRLGYNDSLLNLFLAMGFMYKKKINHSLNLLDNIDSAELSDHYALDLIKIYNYYFLGMYHRMNYYIRRAIQIQRTPFALDLWNRFFEDPNIHLERLALLPLCRGKGLDIGCGHRKTHPNAIGVDLTPKGELGKNGNVQGQVSTADVVASGDNLYMFEDDSMDYIVERHNLEHHKDFVKALQEWKRVLRPGGLLGMVVPDEDVCDTISLDPTHYHVFTKSFMRRVLELIGGFTISHLEPLDKNWSFLCVCVKRPHDAQFDYKKLFVEFEKRLLERKQNEFLSNDMVAHAAEVRAYLENNFSPAYKITGAPSLCRSGSFNNPSTGQMHC